MHKIALTSHFLDHHLKTEKGTLVINTLVAHSEVRKDPWELNAQHLEFWWHLGGRSLALLLKSHRKTSVGPQQNWGILEILSMEKSDTLRWPSAKPTRLVKCDLDWSSAELWVYSEPEIKPSFCLGSSARAPTLLRHTASRYRERSALQPWAGRKQQQASSTFPTSDFQEQKRLEKRSKNKEPQEARTLLFRAHFTSLWPVPPWYSMILWKQQILTNVLRDMWWGKGCFHWEVAKLILPIWWYHY